jgi:AcrR family transcriptional regulator
VSVTGSSRLGDGDGDGDGDRDRDGDGDGPGPPRRGRRPRTYAAVLAATTRLLETVPLADLSVAQILEAAGVGRTSFYEHFSSKEDVVVKLLRSVSADIAQEIEPMFTRGQRTPEQAFREGLTRLVSMWGRYAPLMLTGSTEWPDVPELRRLWLRIHADLTARIAGGSRRDGAGRRSGVDDRAGAAGLTHRRGRRPPRPRGADRPARRALRRLDLRAARVAVGPWAVGYSSTRGTYPHG